MVDDLEKCVNVLFLNLVKMKLLKTVLSLIGVKIMKKND